MDARKHLEAVLTALGTNAMVDTYEPDTAKALHDARNFLAVPELIPGQPTVGESLVARVNQDQHNMRCLRTWPKYDALGVLAMLAIDIALEAAVDVPSRPGYYTYVNRDTVREIRAVLESAGIDWKAQHKQIRSKT